MNWRQGLLVATALGSICFASQLHAASPAREFPYTRQTNLAPGAYKFVFSLYESVSAPTPLWSSGQINLALKTPLLVYTLGSGTVKIPKTIDFTQQLYLKVDKTFPLPKVVIADRERLAVVPFAMASGNPSLGTITAVNAGPGLSGGGASGDVTLSVDTATIQPRVAGECNTGSAIRAVRPDGTVICEPVAGGAGDISAVTAGTGLTGGGESGPVEISANIGTGAGQVAAGNHGHGDLHYTEAEVEALLATRDATIASLQTELGAVKGDLDTLKALLQHFSRSGNEIAITGANLRIVSGSGVTSGTTNGLGNLIIGYNAPRAQGNDRSGSHNLVIGDEQNYNSYGGLVVGKQNAITGPYASVSGGVANTASGESSAVSGGYSNTASGVVAAVSGGSANIASLFAASVSGGWSNTASGDYSAVSGGGNNIASGLASSVSGGGHEDPTVGNTAKADYSSISGGYSNVAGDRILPDPTIGKYATVAGGVSNTAKGQSSVVSGGSGNEASGLRSSVSGGLSSSAIGDYSSVSGGFLNTASGESSAVSGGWSNTASGDYSAVSGGGRNIASGQASSVSGGGHEDPNVGGNTAKGHYSSISGGYSNVTGDRLLTDPHLGIYATVAGGYNNTARGQSSVVSGGASNSTSGEHSSVSGGVGRIAWGESDWWGGGLFQEQ